MSESSPASPASSSGRPPLEWSFLQCFGERTAGEEVQEADIISAVEFDHDGRHLATGDRGGRVVLFERISAEPRSTGMEARPPPSPAARLANLEYKYYTEFQSHEPEFDYLKSLEIEEKINQVRWVPHDSPSRLLLSTNDKTVKLWKVYNRRCSSVTEFNVLQPQTSWSIPAGGPTANVVVSPMKSKLAALTETKLHLPLRIPKVMLQEPQLTSRAKRIYGNGHVYHINSISVGSDCETFLSADDLRVNLWHLDRDNLSFQIVDMKPPNMEDLTEVITCADFHPVSCATFAYSTSKGSIRLGDMRAAALCDRHVKSFENLEPQSQRSFFSEIISSISNFRFSRDGRFILARDYMNVKLWDLRSEANPVSVYPVHECMRSQLCDLYENDCIFDKFDCCISGAGDHVASGTYSNFFRVMGRGGEREPSDTLLEASRDPLRRRLQPQKATPSSRFGLSRGVGAKRGSGTAGAAQNEGELVSQDLQSKLLHLAWHPTENVIATAASNSLYLYCAR